MGLLLVVFGEGGDIGVEVGDGLVEFGDVDVLGVKFGAELFELLVFLFELLHHFIDGGFELVAFH